MAGQTPKPVVLELGGNAPVVVFDDADLERVLATVGSMALINAGQDCMAATRVIVADALADAIVDGLADRFAEAVMGDAQDRRTTLGPLISAVQRDRVAALVEGARASGEVVTGGTAPDRPGFFYEPTIVTGLHQRDDLVQQECFGPVVTVQLALLLRG